MADFTTVITDAGVIDADEITIFSNTLMLAATPELAADQFASVRDSGIGKVFQFAKYANLDVPSALSDGVDPASVALADSVVTITPAEEGNVITLTINADIESGLKAGRAASQLIGRNMGTTIDKRAVTALDGATTNLIYPNAATAVSELTANDVLDGTFAGRLYNKLARANVPGLFGGLYGGLSHDDCLHDLREDTSTGGWVNVKEYADPQSVLRNEVGMYKGIRWVRSGNSTVTADGGAGSVDTYEVHVVGFNALGYAASKAPGLVISGPFDKLRRTINIGWYGMFAYGLIDEANMVSGQCASSVGSN